MLNSGIRIAAVTRKQVEKTFSWYSNVKRHYGDVSRAFNDERTQVLNEVRYALFPMKKRII